MSVLKYSVYYSGMANAWYKSNLLADDLGKKIFVCITWFFFILIFVIVFVSISSCKRKEEFDDVPSFSAVSERATKLKAAVDAAYKRVCSLDGFVGTGVAANFETTLNLKVGLVSKDEIEAGRPQRIQQATQQMMAKKAEQLGKDCSGNLIGVECFEDLGDWKLLDKDIQKTLQRLRIALITVFKWISPNTRGFGKTAAIEPFAMVPSALYKFMDSCPLAPLPQQQEVPVDYKLSLWSQLAEAETYVPQLIGELTILERIQKKLKDKKERLERGELSDEDMALGSDTTESKL